MKNFIATALCAFSTACATPNQIIIAWQTGADEHVAATAIVGQFMKEGEWEKAAYYGEQFQLSYPSFVQVATTVAAEERKIGHCENAKQIVTHYQLDENELPRTCGVRFLSL